MSRHELRFLERLGESWMDATPGFCVQAYFKGKKRVDIEVGETYPYYDWASLTKTVFTTTALMFLHDEKRFRIHDPVSKWVGWYPKEQVTRLRDLLCHSAGLTWWSPFFRSLVRNTSPDSEPEEAWAEFETIFKRRVLSDLKKKKGPPEKSVYSDLDFFMLGFALEKMAETTLYESWQDIKERVGMTNTDFHRNNRSKRSRKLYAPTENCRWRKQVLQGEVHDENAWALKGVAPHAGLFGPIEDLSRWGLCLRAALRGEEKKRFPSPQTVRLFTKRAIPRAKGDWALGFMMPTKGAASCGPLFSSQSVGHTGFTGTSVWYDPKKDLLVTILSNRIHPTRANKEFQRLRPMIHTWIAEDL